MKVSRINKIFLINSSIQGLGSKYEKTVNYSCYPPLGLIKLATRIKKIFPSIIVNIIDAEIIENNMIENMILSEKPEMIGFSVLSSTYENALRVANFAKKNGTRYIVFGNDHASLFPDLILKNREYVDFVIQGDNGDYDFCDLVKAIINGSDPFKRVRNIYGRKNNIIEHANKTSKIYDKIKKESIDIPDIGLLDEVHRMAYKYNYNRDFGGFHQREIMPATVNNAKGCTNIVNHCLYCGIYDLVPQWGDPKMFWKTVYNYNKVHNVNLIFEVCDNFGGLKKYRHDLIATMPDWFENSDIELIVYSRAYDIYRDKKLIEELNQLHVKRVIIGLESGSENAIKNLRKGHPKGKEVLVNKYAVEKVASAGIQLHSSFILGSLGENDESINDTKLFIEWLTDFNNVVSIEVSPLYPVPSSPSWDLLLGITPSKYYGVNIEKILNDLNLNNYKKGWQLAREAFINNDIIDNKLACEIWCNYFTHVPYKKLKNNIGHINDVINKNTLINTGAYI